MLSPADMPWQSDRSGINLYIFSAGIFRSRKNSMEVIVMKKTSFFTARNIAYFAVLLALVVVLQLFASAVPMFGITLNFSLIPIVLAGIFFGAPGGGLLGLASGVVTFITAAVMGREPATAFLFQANPALLTLVCIGKTTVAGAVAGMLYRLVAKKSAFAASYVASVAVPVLNTGLYLLGMVAMKSDVAAYLGTEAAAGAVFVAVLGLIWINFLLEILIDVLLAPALYRVVSIVERTLGGKKSGGAPSAVEKAEKKENPDEENAGTWDITE